MDKHIINLAIRVTNEHDRLKRFEEELHAPKPIVDRQKDVLDKTINDLRNHIDKEK